uniref:Uncharacterized protein n=1 Tax=Zea mays TaxID=4577 RepID=C4J918_MAIZE|nr:unknown [Zea mays]
MVIGLSHSHAWPAGDDVRIDSLSACMVHSFQGASRRRRGAGPLAVLAEARVLLLGAGDAAGLGDLGRLHHVRLVALLLADLHGRRRDALLLGALALALDPAVQHQVGLLGERAGLLAHDQVRPLLALAQRRAEVVLDLLRLRRLAALRRSLLLCLRYLWGGGRH